jgi:hypothetical protein
MGNQIDGANQKFGYELDVPSYNITLDSNTINSYATGWFSNWGGTTMGGSIYNFKKMFVGTGAPKSGSWRSGDVIYRSGSTASGWKCVGSGSPGRWQAF